MPIEEILHQPIHLNPYIKLDISSNNPCFYCIPSKHISDNYNKTTIIRDLFIFLKPGLISSMTFEEKIGLSNVKHKIVLYLTCNHWRQILKLEASPKFILKTFCYKNKGTRKIRGFPK